MLGRLQSSEGLRGAGGLASPMTGKLGLALNRRLQFLVLGAHLEGFGDRTAWRLVIPEQVIQETTLEVVTLFTTSLGSGPLSLPHVLWITWPALV